MIRLAFMLSLLTFWNSSNGQNPLAQALAPSNSIQASVNQFVVDPSIQNGSFSFYCIDLDSQKVIASYDERRSLVPASTQKVVTTATALDVLGPNYRTKTLIQYTGYIDTNCVLHGDVYIKGGGDPALGGDRFKKRYEGLMQKWANAIVQLGIDSIDGRVIGDATAFSDDIAPATWIWGDLGNYYGAGPCGLSIYENKLRLEFSSGPEAGDSTTIICTKPYVPGLLIDNQVKAAKIKNDQAYIVGGPYAFNRVAKGAIPKGKESFEVRSALPDPAYLAAFDFEHELHMHGVKVGKHASTLRRLRLFENFVDTAERQEVFKTYSPALSSLIKYTNMYSVNLYAEHILNFIALRKKGKGSTTSGANYVLGHWKKKGVDVTGMYVSDGSGLSRFNAINAKQMVQILAYMRTSKHWKVFKGSLPVAGKSGTLTRYCRGSNSYNNLTAKSGTMTRVKSFAGYVKSKSGRNLAFCMIVNNFTCSQGQLKKKLEVLMNTMGDFNG